MAKYINIRIIVGLMRYRDLVELYEKLEKTTKRLEKTHHISEFLKKVKTEELDSIMLLLQGKVFPKHEQKKIGVADRLVMKSISIATGIEANDVEKEWKRRGDLGLVAESLTGKKRQRTLFEQELSVKKVFENLRKLPAIEGKGAVERKIKLVAELLTSAKPIEAKYIIRTVLEEMRIGIGEGTIRDSILWAFFPKEIGLEFDLKENIVEYKNKERYKEVLSNVQRSYDLTNDFSKTVETAKTKGEKGLTRVEMIPGVPIKVMLALKVDSIDEGFERVGKPCDAEYKLDGFRLQCHRKGDKIWLFTRRLENVTAQFPDVAEYIKKYVKGEEYIIDCEAVGFDPKTGIYRPFQSISQRIKRKYHIERLIRELPVELNVFDAIYYKGKNLIREPFEKRRKLIEGIVKNVPRKIVVVKNIITGKESEIKRLFEESIKAGNEGLMLKKLDSPYKPGARVGYMVKLKGEAETLDLVIVGAEWGEGKRSNWLTSYILACREGGKLKTVGKASTGLKEKEEEGLSFVEMTKMLRPLAEKEEGKKIVVKPKIVIEVGYEEIQKSPTYESGFALRFPRVIKYRPDRGPKDCSTLGMVEKLYKEQKKK